MMFSHIFPFQTSHILLQVLSKQSSPTKTHFTFHINSKHSILVCMLCLLSQNLCHCKEEEAEEAKFPFKAKGHSLTERAFGLKRTSFVEMNIGIYNTSIGCLL